MLPKTVFSASFRVLPPEFSPPGRPAGPSAARLLLTDNAPHRGNPVPYLVGWRLAPRGPNGPANSPFLNAEPTLAVTPRIDSLASILLAQVVLTGTVHIPAADTSQSREIREELARTGRVTLIVTLEDGLADRFEDGLGSERPAPRSGAARRRAAPLAERKIAYARCQEACLEALDGSSVRVKYRYRYSPTLAVEIDNPDDQELVERLPNVRSVVPDAQGRGVLDLTREFVRADDVHDLGITGEGSVVAVLDSGADFDHPDLSAAVIAEFAHHFLNQGNDTGAGAEDGHDHGSHVTGIIASRGETVAPLGIAPSARIVVVKVLDNRNRGWFSDWAAGLDYVVGLHEEDNGLEIDLVNMSIASNARYPGVCDNAHGAILGAATAARELGIALFVASGNDSSWSTMAMPACMTPAFSVGATLASVPESLASFTNRNALLDLVAPGESIVSTSHNGGVTSISGTSQATPHVVGVACLLLEADPTLTPQEIHEILVTTGVPVFDSLSGLTFPRIDALRAIGAVIVPEVTSLTCEFVPEGRRLMVTWDSVADAETLSITVSRDGQSIHEAAVPASTTSWSRDGVIGGEYSVVVTASIGVLTGRSSRCSTSVARAEELFRRGDCNDDEVIDLADPISTLLFLFVETVDDPPCLRACDSDDDNLLNIVDAVYSLGFLFRGETAPPPPYPGCGTDDTRDEPLLDCVTSRCG